MTKPDPESSLCYNSQGMKRAGWLVLLSVLCSSQTAEDIVSKVEGKLHSLQSLQANFDQIYYSMSVTTPLREKGKFYFKKPDWMRWEYKEPEEKIFLYKEGTFLFYLPEDNQLIRSSLSKEKYESEILALLSGQKEFKDNYLVEFNLFPSEEETPWQLKLTPKEEGEYSFILLEIEERTWLIRKAIFFDWAGNKTEFEFSQMKVNSRLSQNLFELKVPPDCEIIEDKSGIKK